jgi:1-acyl-sn-glycerol-3-phosphate acyltransferase
MRWAGGIPVDRVAAEGVTDAAVASFRSEAQLCLAIAPEGTRRRVERWKTGFWRIARGAGVPIWPVALDWSRRVVQLMPPFHTTEDMEADLFALRSRYTAAMARKPGQYVP